MRLALPRHWLRCSGLDLAPQRTPSCACTASRDDVNPGEGEERGLPGTAQYHLQRPVFSQK